MDDINQLFNNELDKLVMNDLFRMANFPFQYQIQESLGKSYNSHTTNAKDPIIFSTVNESYDLSEKHQKRLKLVNEQKDSEILLRIKIPKGTL